MIPLFASAFIDAMRAGVALERNTVHPWVLTLEFTHPDHEGTQRLIKIVQSPLSRRPEAYEHLPAGATLLREDSLPAERFAGMAVEIRPRYRAQFDAYLRQQDKAASMGPADLVGHRGDYDPTMLDYLVERWVRQGSSPLGD